MDDHFSKESQGYFGKGAKIHFYTHKTHGWSFKYGRLIQQGHQTLNLAIAYERGHIPGGNFNGAYDWSFQY